ncbi:hypothetical protein C8F04DRAFT_1192835 [Mycena alexandri]|uniref:Uncharacterized protein n=1 Tax=Mycena alexandri TaxID=1745969 RepID=A0AAD6WR31_9AGAR|nr:hypothetical protein C8F04DRAFT_1192835 [Mycena alexandri]
MALARRCGINATRAARSPPRPLQRPPAARSPPRPAVRLPSAHTPLISLLGACRCARLPEFQQRALGYEAAVNERTLACRGAVRAEVRLFGDHTLFHRIWFQAHHGKHSYAGPSASCATTTASTSSHTNTLPISWIWAREQDLGSRRSCGRACASREKISVEFEGRRTPRELRDIHPESSPIYPTLVITEFYVDFETTVPVHFSQNLKAIHFNLIAREFDASLYIMSIGTRVGSYSAMAELILLWLESHVKNRGREASGKRSDEKTHNDRPGEWANARGGVPQCGDLNYRFLPRRPEGGGRLLSALSEYSSRAPCENARQPFGGTGF